MAKREAERQYLPLVVLARLHTAKTYEEVKTKLKGQGFTAKQMKAIVRSCHYFDGLEVYLSKWNYDGHKNWHLYTWKQTDDEKVKLALFEAEQYHPFASSRYKGDFAKFEKDWKSGEYDPGMTFEFADEEAEVIEVVQEEVDNIDHEKVKRTVQKEREEKQQRKRRFYASKGSRYRKKYF